MNKSQTTFTNDSPSQASSLEKLPIELQIRYKIFETMLITEDIQPSKKRCLGLTISPSKLLILDKQDTGSPLVPSSLETNHLNGVEILKDMSPPLDDDAVFS